MGPQDRLPELVASLSLMVELALKHSFETRSDLHQA